MVLQEMQKSIDQMFIADPAVLRKIQQTRMEGDKALQESQQSQQQTEEQRRQKAAQDAEAARLRQAQDLAGSLVGMPGSGDLLPGGTSFFGLGGGPGTAPLSDPWNDPMVVDLRHLRRASYMVQAVETSTTEDVPALLEKALAAVNGPVPDLPAGAVPPFVDGKGLEAFRKAYREYAGTRAALARSEAALKEARRRKKERGGPEADAAWEKARAAYDAAKERAYGSREEAVRVLRALGAGKDPQAFRPPVPSLPALREETWVEMQRRMMAERVAIDALTKRTQKELLSVVPPVKGAFRKVHEVVVLGFGTDNNDADRMMKDGVSPFSNGKSYASMNEAAVRARAEGKEGVGGAVVVSFGTPKGEENGGGNKVTDFKRVVGDHFFDGATSLDTPQARDALAKISGKECDRLVAHSNGATVAEALIREDRVRVNELNIVGGDMSMVKRGDYQDLVDSGKVKRVVVWVNLNDPVVWTTSVSPSKLGSTGNDVAESLARKIVGVPTAGVEYRFMWGADYRILAPPKDLSETAKRMSEAVIARHYVESSYYPGIANERGVDYTLPVRVRDDKPEAPLR
ncbi:hypothetical protein [Candidatus Deferrimicrobium sp.]|uniref:hypothetical protein n=1 Tax=Candidatus Deferrimicrobium sp. TaxID=3060586 RepID=UPI002729F93E|nr:hypothetical protein [Candidatus Deferrimicrobium sp.]